MTIICRLLVIVLTALILVSAAAPPQTPEPQLVEDGMLDCVLHEPRGPWLSRQFMQDELLRFNYVVDVPRKDPGPYDYGVDDGATNLITVFWTPDRSKGRMLALAVSHSKRRLWLTIGNEGDLIYSSGGLKSFNFFQGGEWMRAYYELRIKKLRAEPTQTIAIRDVRRTRTLCDSLLDPHPEWEAAPPSE